MKKLNSTLGTLIAKWIFPVFFFGFIVFFLIMVSFMGDENDAPPLIFFIVPVIMAVGGFYMMKRFVFDLFDEVYDEGNSLLFKKGAKTVRVKYQDIQSISYETLSNPPRVSVRLRHPTEFGRKLSFCPPRQVLKPFAEDPHIQDLIDRIDQVRK